MYGARAWRVDGSGAGVSLLAGVCAVWGCTRVVGVSEERVGPERGRRRGAADIAEQARDAKLEGWFQSVGVGASLAAGCGHRRP